MPDFFERHELSSNNRFETWTTFRGLIEKELSQIVEIMKKDKRVDPNNIFAVGYSNSGYWASYLTATNQVNAGASHFSVAMVFGYPDNFLIVIAIQY
jgi:poly(3-hydroxybutyrate) depolymerase